jgi:hypothetical protein
VGLAVVHAPSRGVTTCMVRLRCPKSFIPPGYPGRMSWYSMIKFFVLDGLLR